MSYVAIQTKFLGATDRRGSRIKATAMEAAPTSYGVDSYQRPEHYSVTLSYAHELDSFENHERAAKALLPKVSNDPGKTTLYAGGTDTGYVFVPIRADLA